MLSSIEVFNTCQCREISPLLNDFENSFFGPDFFCHYEWIQPWIDSGCLFSAAVLEPSGLSEKNILAAASIFITHSASRDALMRGKIADYQLEPWHFGGEDSAPVYYASSMISSVREHRFALYRSLLTDLGAQIQEHGLRVRSGFAIASCEAGYRHLTKIGFSALGTKYLDKYDFLAVDVSAAQNAFWQALLRFGANTSSDFLSNGEPPTSLGIGPVPEVTGRSIAHAID